MRTRTCCTSHSTCRPSWISERYLKRGRKLRFFLCYFVAMVTGSLVSSVWAPGQVSLGASGAILGLAGGLFAYGRQFLESEEDRKTLRKNLLVWVAALMVLGLFLPLDNAAHLGGFVGGLACAWIIRKGTATKAQALGRFVATASLITLLLGAWFLLGKRVGSIPTLEARLHYLEGLALEKAGELPQAAEAFQRAAEISPEPTFLRRAASEELNDSPSWRPESWSIDELSVKRDLDWIPYKQGRF